MLLDDSAVLQARVALRLPWWSLSTGFEAVRQMAGLQGDASGVHRALKEQTYAANGALPPGAMPAKDDRQVLQTAALQTCQYCMVFYVIRGVTIRSRHKPPGSK
jgi:hypothetical protein